MNIENVCTAYNKEGHANTAEPAKRAFSDNGEEIFDMDQILDDDLVYISAGPDFIVGHAGSTGGGRYRSGRCYAEFISWPIKMCA